MLFDKCPGRDRRKLKAETVTCSCGYGVEIFSDELKRICPACGKEVTRQSLPSCVLWCKSAAQCMGYTGPSKNTRREK
jgi:predicted RNA-binding Zn-ribbon protein involved in translation (DUF1610 family)